MFSNLPNECIYIIYDYDNTYKLIFNKIIKDINTMNELFTHKKQIFIESVPYYYFSLLDLTKDDEKYYYDNINKCFSTFYFEKYYWQKKINKYYKY